MAEISVSGIVRLTRDAEVKKFSSGTAFNFGICAYRKYVKEGKQDVDFFEADIWLKEDPAGYGPQLIRGSLMYIENGQLRNNQYKSADGQDRNKVSIHISSFEFINTKDGSFKVPEPPPYIPSNGQKEPFKASKVSLSSPVAPKPIPVPETVIPDDIEIPEFPDKAPF